MYTSGTTGQPKGVELTHRNFISQQKAFSLIWDLNPHHRLLSYLPWHHCFGGIFETFMAVYFGIPMAIDGSRGKDFGLLVENWQLIRPTLYLSVPAIYQAMIRAMEEAPELEKIFFHKDLEFVLTAAAPLPPDIYEIFIRRGIPVHEGWGLTESSPDITLTRPGKKHRPGIVGTVIPGVELKIEADGEILARGVNIMKGYYRNPQATRKVLDSEGWLHTGDLGEMTEEGLRIVGRADGVFKLVNGEKVPSAHIEGLLIAGSCFIDRAVVCGRGQDFVCAIIFCNEGAISSWAKKKGISFSSFEKLLECDEVRSLLQEDVRTTNQKMKEKFFRVKRFYLAPSPPTLARGEITPTAKTCRQKVMKNYEIQVSEMFQESSFPGSPSFVEV
jgi:long-subunit acyl-CoA synthetase (AMP-forming)